MTDPETVLYVAWLGLFLQGRLTEADVHFRRALSADPQHRDNLEEFAYHLNIRVSIIEHPHLAYGAVYTCGRWCGILSVPLISVWLLTSGHGSATTSRWTP